MLHVLTSTVHPVLTPQVLLPRVVLGVGPGPRHRVGRIRDGRPDGERRTASVSVRPRQLRPAQRGLVSLVSSDSFPVAQRGASAGDCQERTCTSTGARAANGHAASNGLEDGLKVQTGWCFELLCCFFQLTFNPYLGTIWMVEKGPRRCAGSEKGSSGSILDLPTVQKFCPLKYISKTSQKG